MWKETKKEEEEKEERQGRDEKRRGRGEAIKPVPQAQLCPQLLLHITLRLLTHPFCILLTHLPDVAEVANKSSCPLDVPSCKMKTWRWQEGGRREVAERTAVL